jgi:hypothetical protein
MGRSSDLKLWPAAAEAAAPSASITAMPLAQIERRCRFLAML